MNCILCASDKSLHLHAHRNENDKIVGMVYLCSEHSKNLLHSSVTIDYELKGESNPITTLLPIKIDHL